MKKKLVGLALGILAFVSMFSTAQAGTKDERPTFNNGEVIATAASQQVINVVAINDSRQGVFVMKSDGKMGGGSGSAIAKAGGDGEDHFGKMAKADNGAPWKSASDSGPLQKAISIIIRADYTITLRPLLTSSRIGNDGVISTARPDGNFLHTSNALAVIYGEKFSGVTILGAGAYIALEPNDYGWHEARST